MKTARPLLAAILLTACASSAAWPVEADRAFQDGDWERALALYREARESRPGDPMLAEKVAAARDRAVEARIWAARAAVDRGDHAAARAELAAARDLGADGDAIAAEEAAVAAREGSAGDVVSRARSLLAAGRPEEAERLLAALGDGARGVPGGPALLAEARAASARRTAADRSAAARTAVAEGRAALAAGRLGAVFDALARAGTDAPADSAALRTALAGEFRSRAAAALDGGRPACALWFARAALDAQPGHRDAETLRRRAEEAAASAYGRSLLVGPVDDRTGGRCDPAAFRDLLAGALASAGPSLLSVATSGTAGIELRGEVHLLEVADLPVSRADRTHEVLVRVEHEPNPARPGLETALQDAQTRRADAESAHDAVERELEELERLRGSARVRASDGFRYGPYNEAAYWRLLGEARRREAEARAYTERLAREEEAARQRLDAAPLLNERRILGRVSYVEETIGRAGAARGTFSLTGGTSFSAEAQHRVTDRVVRGRPEAGLPDDPDELPSPGRVAEAVLGRLATEAAARAAALLAGERRALIEEARAAERSGDAAGSAEKYAAFLLVTGSDLAVERSVAARQLGRVLGFDPLALAGGGGR